jgi:hypothetical protein
MTEQPPWEPPTAIPPPAPKRRHRIRTGLLAVAVGVAGLVVVGVVLSAIPSGQQTSAPKSGSDQAAVATAPADSAPPVADPEADGTGTCDISLDPEMNGNDYLTAFVTVRNTGNVGQTIRVRVAWPQVGFADVVRSKTIRLPYGATRHVSLRVAATSLGYDAIGAFQDTPAYNNSEDPCTYKLTNTGTFGPVH